MKALAPLKHARDFTRILKLGRSARSGFVRLHLLYPGGGESKLGIVVTKKAGGAVIRNLIRRRLAHITRDFSQLFLKPAHIVLYVNHDISRAGFKELSDSTGMLFESSGLIEQGWQNGS